jgi:hypothetical protein
LVNAQNAILYVLVDASKVEDDGDDDGDDGGDDGGDDSGDGGDGDKDNRSVGKVDDCNKGIDKEIGGKDDRLSSNAYGLDIGLVRPLNAFTIVVVFPDPAAPRRR